MHTFHQVTQKINFICSEYGIETNQGKLLFLDSFYKHFPKHEVTLLGSFTDIWFKNQRGYMKIPTRFYNEKNIRFMATTRYIELDKIEILNEYEVPDHIIEMFLDVEHLHEKISYFENLVKQINACVFEKGNPKKFIVACQREEYEKKIEELEEQLFNEQEKFYYV